MKNKALIKQLLFALIGALASFFYRTLPDCKIFKRIKK